MREGGTPPFIARWNQTRETSLLMPISRHIRRMPDKPLWARLLLLPGIAAPLEAVSSQAEAFQTGGAKMAGVHFLPRNPLWAQMKYLAARML
ncbi:hypothetical protein EYF80_049652 [Liparis tanakae]|uniref:Uncharacterized protein n=1 Tax=Liparis tanakae TaxID=230148 RepID=A0A4Z2FG74_9TELE|nr:hypothetical protein EYF80_049652 [Liparis tanakae]